MASSPTQPRILPIEDLVFDGLKKRLTEVFQVPSIISNASDEIQLLKRLREGNVTYPYIFLALTAFSVGKETYRSHSMYRNGLNTKLVSTDQNFTYNVKLLPTDFTFEVRYLDNDFARLIKFAKLWLFSSQSGFLKFTVQYGNSMDIGMMLEESLTIPKREADPTNVAEYELTTTLTVHGYSSQEQLVTMPIVKEVTIDFASTDIGTGNSSVFMTFPVTQSIVDAQAALDAANPASNPTE